MDSHSPTDLRCVCKGGGGWECKGWRIVGSNFCQKHYNYFEERKTGMRRKTSIEAAEDETEQHQVQIEEDKKGYKFFMEGQEVEVLKRCSWYTAKILKVPNRKGKKDILVEYDKIVLGVKRSVPFSREFVDPSLIRPQPSPSTQVYGINDVVEAFHKEGWWKGEVAKVHECSGSTVYTIYFHDLGEKIDTAVDKLRVHQEWVGGKWVTYQEVMEAGKQLRDQVPHLFDVSVCILDRIPTDRDARDLVKGEQSQVRKAVDVFDTSCNSVKMYSKTKRHRKEEVEKGSLSQIEDHEKSILIKPVTVPGMCNDMTSQPIEGALPQKKKALTPSFCEVDVSSVLNCAGSGVSPMVCSPSFTPLSEVQEEPHHDTKSFGVYEINQEKKETEQTTTFVETTKQLKGIASESLTSVPEYKEVAESRYQLIQGAYHDTKGFNGDENEVIEQTTTVLETTKESRGTILKSVATFPSYRDVETTSNAEAGSFSSIKNNSMWETFNTMSVDQLEKLLRLKTQLEELKQVEGKIVKEKHEEESLKAMVDKIDEKLKELRKSRIEMEKKQERIVMKTRENASCVITLQKKVQEIEAEMRGVGLRFNRVAARPW